MTLSRTLRVLYVDDDRVNALLFSETCRCLDAQGLALDVETAGSGDEALELVAGWRPDALVIDLHLPDTDGHALLPRLRAALGDAGSGRPIPAWLCTADEGPGTAEAARAAGFDGCWTKPLEAPTLLAALQTTPTRGTPPATGTPTR